MVKFRHTYDPQDMGKQEYHYNKIAKQCGIQVPDPNLSINEVGVPTIAARELTVPVHVNEHNI